MGTCYMLLKGIKLEVLVVFEWIYESVALW